MPSLIAPDNDFAVMAALLCIVSCGLLVERTAVGSKLSAPLFALGAGMVFANLRVLPFESTAYGFVITYLVPLSIPLLLLNADLKRIFRETGPTLVAFLAGALGTILGAALGHFLIDVGPETSKIVGVLAATFIGGSFNFVAVSKALAIEDTTLIAAAATAQGIGGIVYFSVLIYGPSMGVLQRAYGPAQPEVGGAGKAEAAATQAQAPSALNLPACLTFSLVVCALGHGLANLSGTPQFSILYITVLTVAVASLAPRFTAMFEGAENIALVLVYIFIASVGAQSNVWLLAGTALALVAFLALVLTMHVVCVLVAGRLFGLTLPEVLIGSNACALGASTAAAVAASNRWHSLITPGVLSGILGYVIANFIGVGLSTLLSRLG